MTQCSVCGSKGSTLTSTDDLDATQQARFQEQNAEKPTGFLLCTLCVPAPFCAKKTAASSVPGTNVGTNEGSVSSVSSAAKKKPKKPVEKKHVAKRVTVDQRVEEYGKYGLYTTTTTIY